MIFEKYRKRIWRSKLYSAVEEAKIMPQIINTTYYESDKQEYRKKYLNLKSKIGKYKGLLELQDEDYIKEINKILNEK